MRTKHGIMTAIAAFAATAASAASITVDRGYDATKTATLTIVPSSGNATEFARDGTGVTPFNFGPGAYTVTLAADGYATRTAEINVTGGFVITFR